MSPRARKLYDRIYAQPYEATGFAYRADPEQHPFYGRLKPFISNNGLADKRCLEVGVGRGAFQNLVSDYIGVDISIVAGKCATKPFSVADAMQLPFPDSTFGGIWTTHVLEHLERPERALQEMWRVLEPGGFLFIVARWQVGRWAAKGLEARPYAELGLKEKFIKASVPIRTTVWFRALRIMPKRLWRVLGYCANSVPSRLNYGKLNPNINEHIGPDSSAESSIDPFEVWLWYRSRGAICLNYPTLLAGYFIRTGALTFQKPMNAKD